MTAQIVRITDDTTRPDLAETLALLNAEAKAISRRGKAAMLGEEYRLRHEYINSVLEDWEAAPA